MSAQLGRDYWLSWTVSRCADGGDHDPLEIGSPASYEPLYAFCQRCSARATTVRESSVR